MGLHKLLLCVIPPIHFGIYAHLSLGARPHTHIRKHTHLSFHQSHSSGLGQNVNLERVLNFLITLFTRYDWAVCLSPAAFDCTLKTNACFWWAAQISHLEQHRSLPACLCALESVCAYIQRPYLFIKLISYVIAWISKGSVDVVLHIME